MVNDFSSGDLLQPQAQGSVTVQQVEGVVYIRVRGEFTFKIRQAFREAYSREPSSSQFVVDLTGVNSMDSSAMGMLLVLREYAGGDRANIALTNLTPRMAALLKLANLNELFKFS
ncbi:MAG: STAS domain-containing protein [Magnetococcales bacterium]|nr:STAS domain-containing protein [Magnetococcales bacterium]MBF0439609.1 STAS domain-containing protein [Magnetococcales bacterium]